MTKNLSLLEKKIKIKFKNQELLQQALTHRSYLNEHPNQGLSHNERLEFLGDAIIEFVVTRYLYKNYLESEGVLTSWRASLVNTNMLFKIAKEISLDKYIYLSRGESSSFTGCKKTQITILADALEALVGAIFLDQGLKKTDDFLIKMMVAKLPHVLKHKLYEDPKSRFQEITQSNLKITPTYKSLKEEGPDHAKKFTVGVFLNDSLVTKAVGQSKQEASLKAAAKALKKYVSEGKIKK